MQNMNINQPLELRKKQSKVQFTDELNKALLKGICILFRNSGDHNFQNSRLPVSPVTDGSVSK